MSSLGTIEITVIPIKKTDLFPHCFFVYVSSSGTTEVSNTNQECRFLSSSFGLFVFCFLFVLCVPVCYLFQLFLTKTFCVGFWEGWIVLYPCHGVFWWVQFSSFLPLARSHQQSPTSKPFSSNILFSFSPYRSDREYWPPTWFAGWATWVPLAWLSEFSPLWLPPVEWRSSSTSPSPFWPATWPPSPPPVWPVRLTL